MTLEQLRAKFAWEQAQKYKNEKFKTLAKGAPALIMSNGLMASLAFWQSKQKQDKNNESLVKAILGWLTQRNVVKSIAFETAMQELYSSNSANYMKATNETLDFLKWLRHFAAALNLGEE